MRLLRALAFAAAALVAACDCNCPAPAGATNTGDPQPAPVPLFTCRNGNGNRDAAVTVRDAAAAETFEEYLQTQHRECGHNGKFLVDGDIAIGDVKLLHEFFDDRTRAARPAAEAPPQPFWTTRQKRALIYCVSRAFGSQHDKVVADMEAATGAWEQVANVHFDHDIAQDAACNADNAAVIFDVNPVDVGGEYLARAFTPGEPRADRNLYIDLSALSLDPAQALQLAGVLRHELGHALGFRHDHPRRASPECPGDDPAELTVMSDPRCGGPKSQLLLTDRDKNHAACAYGAAPGFSIDRAVCEAHLPPVAPSGAAILKSFGGQSIARGALKEYPPFIAQPGSLVRVSLQPHGPRPGDPDLYVRLGGEPTLSPPAYTCRPFLTGALETCEIDAGAAPNNLVRILVHGYTAGSYDLDVSIVPLTP